MCETIEKITLLSVPVYLFSILWIKLHDSSERIGENISIQIVILDLFTGFHFPINYMEGVQVDFQKLATDWALLETVQDYENLITR